MTQYEIKTYKELLERIKRVASEALSKNVDTPEGQAAFEEDLKYICDTAETISSHMNNGRTS